MISKELLRDCTRKIHRSVMRILSKNGFYGSLLMHIIFAVDTQIKNVSCDSRRIYFNPAFLAELSDDEIDYALMHQILHIALMHTIRSDGFQKKFFDIACDIVVDSNIYHSCSDDERTITFRGNTAEHKAPDGSEGYHWSAEQLYDVILVEMKDSLPAGDCFGDDGSGSDGTNGSNGSGGEANSENEDDTLNSDNDAGGSDGKNKTSDAKSKNGSCKGSVSKNTEINGSFDDHSKWDGSDTDGVQRDEWLNNIHSAAKIAEILDPSRTRGLIPVCAERILKELTEPHLDWRQLLIDFVQQEICDYSFSPPDRRFDDSPFFLPDFNEKDDCAENILFMVDTSGSMSDAMVTEAYSEIKSAIDQFGGKLKGWLGFFDAKIVEPMPFATEDEFRIIRPKGGGGTSFDIIFEYVNNKMHETPPVCIIILTDGYAPFPDENAAADIPVMWLINNNEAAPPWGKVVRMKNNDKSS